MDETGTATPALDAEVVDAVARILDRDGLAGLSITAIANEADLSRVTLHRRGATIDQYVVAALARASDDLRARLWPILTGPGRAADRLDEALDALCQISERHAGVMMAMYGRPAWPLPERPGRTTSFEFIEPFERLLRDGQLDGSLAVEDPLPDATITANSVAWTYLHMRRAHGWDQDEARRRTIALAAAHLRPDGERTTGATPPRG